VPYPVRQRLLAELPTRGMSLAELDHMLRKQVDTVIRQLTDEVDPSIPAVLTGHFTVQGAKLGSERGVMLGRDVAVLLSTLSDPAWDYVALGHIHYHQDMNKGYAPPVVYSGSVERIDFGEEDDRKGFCWVNLERGATTYEFVEVDSRPFITIKTDVRNMSDPTAHILKAIKKHDIADAVVRVIITTSPETEPLIRDRDIEMALDGCGYVAGIQRDIDYPVRSRLGVERPEGLEPLELLERFLICKDISPDRIPLLMDYAQQILLEPEMEQPAMLL
jgi:DNA repair protein SbcD/Mre11